VYVEYNDEPSLKMVKEINLASFEGYSSIISAEKTLSKEGLLSGTDKYGRDLLQGMLIGSRVSISIGVVAVLISLIVGIFFGAVGGFWRESGCGDYVACEYYLVHSHCFSLLPLHWH
jgi:peptide/nickel transport system permease protein